MIRHSLSFVSWQDRKRLMPALRAIYQNETADLTEQRLAEFEAEWGKRHPAICACVGMADLAHPQSWSTA